MSDEIIENENQIDGEAVNADAIAEAFLDDSHEDDDDEMFYSARQDEDDDDVDVMDTNFEIMDDDKSWH